MQLLLKFETHLIQNIDAMPLFPPPKFFTSDVLNVTELLLRNRKANTVAIHFAREGILGIEKVTWQDLRSRTRAVHDAMLSLGVQVGDKVASVISNSVDAMVICLAALSIGAVWSSASCDLGQDAIVDRFSQIRPKIVFADDGYIYAGKVIELKDRIRQWAYKLGQDDQLSSIVVIPYCQLPIDLSRIRKGCSFESFLRRGTGRVLTFNYLSFNNPAFILYSSGTVMI